MKAKGEKVRIAMIGAGGRATSVIYPSIAGNPDAEFAGVCDIDEERRNAAAKQFGIKKTYGAKGVYEYQEMLKELKPDAVAIIGQPHIMYDLWEWALVNGFNLLIEKPMALSIHQARMLCFLAEKNKLITQVSFQRRYTPMVMQLRDECLKRGPVTHAVCRFYKCGIAPMTCARDHMMDDCVHSIDTLRWICGGEIVKIESHCKRIGVPDINFISATLYFDNGATGYLINTWSSGKRVFEVEIHSPNIYITAEHECKGRLFADNDVEGVEYDSPACAGSDEFHVYTGCANVVEDFVNGIKTGKLPSACFQSSIKTMEAAEIILAQDLLGSRG